VQKCAALHDGSELLVHSEVFGDRARADSSFISENGGLEVWNHDPFIFFAWTNRGWTRSPGPDHLEISASLKCQ
jgi:hypothetical protein